MSKEVLLMLHPTVGVLGILAAVWVFVEAMNVRQETLARLRLMSLLVAVLMWAAYLVGGYWYVVFYGPDKAAILAGPWPFAHKFFMETKEHLFLILLLVATYLPIAAYSNLVSSRGARHLVMWVSALVVGLGLAMEGAGAIISTGVRVAALATQ